MLHPACGIDFGTSNSSIAVADGESVRLVPVEGHQVTIPSAVFFPRGTMTPAYGRAATDLFFAKREGRYMRSLKRLLGTALVKQGTVINGKVMPFEGIIASFLQHLKDKTRTVTETDLEHVVMGRPVHFVDNDPGADGRAQDELEAIARQVGFKHVAFQYEPIAAAFAHETRVRGEKLALVVDLGGGTSDFTAIRLSERYLHKKDRSSDILANTGIRVGGNDFDKNLSLAAIMPHLGYRSTYGEKKLQVPLKLYHDLSEWSKINFLYTVKVLSQVRQLLNQSGDKTRLGRLLRVLETETGHTLLARVEDTKIALTDRAAHEAAFEFIERGLSFPVRREQFEEAIREEVERIAGAATACLGLAGIPPGAVELVILTGGSTEVPLIQAAFRALLPNAALAGENKLSSVGLGLAYDSRKKFG
jgi:hypothetical chaperone protein